MVQEMSCSIDIAYVAHLHLLFRFETEQWRIQGRAPPLFVDQTEAQRAEKQFFETAPPHTHLIWRSGFANAVRQIV